MTIQRKRIREFPPTTRQIAEIYNDIDRAAKRLKRLLLTLETLEHGHKTHQDHLARLRKYQENFAPPKE